MRFRHERGDVVGGEQVQYVEAHEPIERSGGDGELRRAVCELDRHPRPKTR